MVNGRHVSNGPGALYRWGAFAARNRWKVVGAWVAFLVLFGAFSFAVKGQFADRFTIPGAESQTAYDLLNERFPSQAGDVARIGIDLFEACESSERATVPSWTCRRSASWLSRAACSSSSVTLMRLTATDSIIHVVCRSV